MIRIENIGYNKGQHEPKFPLFYTDSEGKGLWMAIKLNKNDENKILRLSIVDREGNEIKGNSISYSDYEDFRERFMNREFLEKDVIIQY